MVNAGDPAVAVGKIEGKDIDENLDDTEVVGILVVDFTVKLVMPFESVILEDVMDDTDSEVTDEKDDEVDLAVELDNSAEGNVLDFVIIDDEGDEVTENDDDTEDMVFELE